MIEVSFNVILKLDKNGKLHNFCERLEKAKCNDYMHLKMKCNIYCQCESKQEMVPINQNKLTQGVLLFENEKNKMEVLFAFCTKTS
jgi:hypothetical protein